MTELFNLGLVYPGGGPEADFYSFERAMHDRLRVYLANSAFGILDGADHHPDALRITAEVPRIASAAKRLGDCKLDALVWACTSGSFVNGRAFAEDQVAQLSERTGIQTTSTSLAFVAAAKELAVDEVAVLSTYPEQATALFEVFLGEFGLKVVSRHFLGNPSGWQSAEMCYEDILEQVFRLDLSQSQALLIPDTALPSLSWMSQLEREIEHPVLSANAVSLWHGLQIGNRQIALPELDCNLFPPRQGG